MQNEQNTAKFDSLS